MLRGRRAAVAAAFAIAAAAAATAGCGGGGTSSALSFDPVAAAATKTEHAGAARIRLTVAFSGPQGQGQTFRLRGSGAIDGTSSELTFKLGSMLGQMGIPSAVRTKLMHASLKEIALEQDGDYVMYLQLGFLSSQLPTGKQWIKLDLSKLGKTAGLDLGKLLSGSQFQPSDLLSLLNGEGTKIRKVGSESVDGVATTHYHMTIDLAEALHKSGAASPLLGSVAPKLKTVSDDVWIGKDGLLRRIRASYGVAARGEQVHGDVSMDLYDYGADVSIAAPADSAVFDATQFAQQRLGSAGLP
ncbi:MAG TPA: hypothetical protein VE985_02585 [Gaiellaceae bacterium]|nr:hypothetical protein [Gaiellaceae bacterium]